MKLLTKDEVQALDHYQMAEYLNEVCKANGVDPFLVWHDGKLFDAEDLENEIVDKWDLYNVLLDYDNEATDLQGKVFADD